MNLTPTGPIYRTLRSRVLDAFPSNFRVGNPTAIPLGDWLSQGYFSVASCGKKEIVIHANTGDLANSLFADVECLTDHCFEQLYELQSFSTDPELRSGAWKVVTLYYLGFFSSQGMLRLLGSPVIFLDRPRMQQLKQLSTSPTLPAAGTYRLEKVQDLSATIAEYRLKMSKQKPHDATWRTVFEILDSALKNTHSGSDAGEWNFYDCLTKKRMFEGQVDYHWPSQVRSLANYRPGFAYTKIQGNDVVKGDKLFNNWSKLSIGEWQSELQRASNACTFARRTEYSDYVSLLDSVVRSMFLIYRSLYMDLIVRRNLDRRRDHKRQAYGQKRNMPDQVACTLSNS